MDQKTIEAMVNRDIVYCEEELKRYSQDRERMEAVFNKLLCRYIEIIENFAQGLKVVSPYDKRIELAVSFSENVSTILERLKAFRENGYSNDGLWEYYLQAMDRNCQEMPHSFEEARYTIWRGDIVKKSEREEILKKLDEMEEIILLRRSKKEKWELLRPYIVWVSGKSFEIARQILPLFLKI